MHFISRKKCRYIFVIFTTRKVAIVMVASVCMYVIWCNFLKVQFWIAGTLPGDMNQVHIWRSLGQGQGHSSNNSLLPHVKLQSAITLVLYKREPWGLCAHGVFGMADRMPWPSSFSHCWKYTHSRVVSLRLEGNLGTQMAMECRECILLS